MRRLLEPKALPCRRVARAHRQGRVGRGRAKGFVVVHPPALQAQVHVPTSATHRAHRRQLHHPQALEDEFDLPACRVGLTDGVGVERVGVDVGEVEPILGALGDPDRDEAQATSSGASGGLLLNRRLHRPLSVELDGPGLALGISVHVVLERRAQGGHFARVRALAGAVAPPVPTADWHRAARCAANPAPRATSNPHEASTRPIDTPFPDTRRLRSYPPAHGVRGMFERRSDLVRFLAVVETGGLARAAERLDMAQTHSAASWRGSNAISVRGCSSAPPPACGPPSSAPRSPSPRAASCASSAPSTRPPRPHAGN